MNLTLSMKPTNSHTPPKQNIGENNFTINEEKLDIIPMFEKIVTPSDVGKLNRLVIPKQHAERHFPRLEQPSAGTLLSFEDCATGESWQFRYSYWGSSQSYVMTKGWSRFVRQKQLSAGDTVSFSSDKHRNCLFISYRHKTPVEIVKISSNTNGHRRKADHRNYDPVYYTPIGKNLQFREKIVADLCSDTNWCCKRSEKRIRLFGVNLEFLGQESNCAPFLDLKL